MAGEWACDKGGVQKEGHQNITLEVVPGELEVTIPENPFEDMENETDLELNRFMRNEKQKQNHIQFLVS